MVQKVIGYIKYYDLSLSGAYEALSMSIIFYINGPLHFTALFCTYKAR